MTHKRWQFEEISVHADNYIKNIIGAKNIAMNIGETKHFFLRSVGSDQHMMSSDDFTIDDVEEIFGGAVGTISDNKIVRQYGNNIVGLITNLRGGNGAFVHRYFSDDNGVSWSATNTGVPELDEDIHDEIQGFDIVIIDDVIWYLYTLLDDDAGTIKTYAWSKTGDAPHVYITGNSIKDLNSVFPGFENADGDYEYMEFGSDDKFYRVIFDGSSFSRTELTDSDLAVPDTWDIARQIYWDKGNRQIILSGNQMYRKLKGVWTLTSVASEQDVVAVIWKKDSSDEYTFDYVIWNDQLYYFLPKGGMIRLQTLSVDARVGYNDWFSTGSAIHQRFNDALIIDKAFVNQEKMGFRIAVFNVYETTFSIGDGIVLTEDDGTPLIIGNVVLNTTIDGVQAQSIVIFSPGRFDLERPILQNFGTVDELAILQLIYANHSEFFYEGNIDDTGNTQTLPSSIRNMHGILKDLEPFGARVLYWELDGKQHYDEADEVALLVKQDYKTGITGVNDWGTSDDPDLSGFTTTIDTSEIVALVDGHVNVHHMNNAVAQEYGIWDIPSTSDDSLEGWIRLAQTNALFVIYIGVFPDFICRLDFVEDGNIDFEGTAQDADIQPYSANEWIHFRIVFKKNDDCNLYINGDLISTVTGKNFDVTKIRYFGTINTEVWIDSLGYSWEGYVPFSNYKIVLTDDNSQIVPNGVINRGQEINAVVVKGGIDPNLPTDQEIPVGIAKVPGVTQQQLIPAIYNIPSLKTQAEVDARAALILASGPSALVFYQIQYFGDGANRPAIPQIGRTVVITNTTHGLTNKVLIVQSWGYSLDNNSIILFASTGLLFLTNNETRDQMNVNTELIYQLARALGLRTIPGLEFYLDNNASDIGGYKKMLMEYAGNAKVTFTNTNAIDGEIIEEFATEPNVPGITLLDDGEYPIHIHALNSQVGSKDARIFFELYKRTTAPAETLLFTSESSSILTLGEVAYGIHAHVSSTIINATDRLVIKIKIGVTGSGADPDIQIFIQGSGGDTTASRFEMPSSSQILANKVNRAGDTMTDTLIIDATVPLILKVAGVEKMRLDSSALKLNNISTVSGDLVLNANAGNVVIDDTLKTINILTNLNKVHNIGSAAVAYDEIFADDFRNVASSKKYTMPTDEEVYQELKSGIEPYIKEILIKEWIEKEEVKREEVPLDYIAKEGEILETHHIRSHSHNIDYLNGVIRVLIKEIEDLKKEVIK